MVDTIKPNAVRIDSHRADRKALGLKGICQNGGDDANSTVVNNLGRAIVKKISVKLEGQEVMSLDDADIYLCYRDLEDRGPEIECGVLRDSKCKHRKNSTGCR